MMNLQRDNWGGWGQFDNMFLSNGLAFLDFDEVTEGDERLHVIVGLVQTSIRRVERSKVRSVRSARGRFVLVCATSVV